MVGIPKNTAGMSRTEWFRCEQLHKFYFTLIQYSSSDQVKKTYVGNLESKERLRIQPAQLFNFS